MKKFLNALIILSIFFVSCKMEYDVLKRDSNIESISVDTSAAKKNSYVVSESFDPTGLKVIAHYTDGTTQEVDLSQVTFENFCSEKANAALPVTAKYQEFTTTFEVCVKENEIERIEVVQKPKKLHYKTDGTEDFDSEGIIVIGYDNLNKERVLKDSEYTITEFGYSNSATNYITVLYNENPEKKAIFPIYFDNWTSISDLKVEVFPKKTQYLLGKENFDNSGMTIKAKINGNDKEIDNAKYSIQPQYLKSLPEGEHEIGVYVNNSCIQKKIIINIIDAYLSGIQVKTKSSTKMFYEGDSVGIFDTFEIYEELTKNDNSIVSGNKINQEFLIQKDYTDKLKFSYNNDCGYEKSTSVINNGNGEKITLSGTGFKTIYFYYSYTDKDNKAQIAKKSITIFVGNSQLDSITAEWKNNGGYPLGVTPDNSNPAYGTWNISLKFVNGTIKSVESGKCSFEYKAGEIEKIKDTVLNGTTKNCPVIVKYADKYCEVPVKVVCPEVLGITAKLLYSNNKIRKNETNFKKYITVNKILQFIPDTPEVTDKENISVTMIEIQDSKNQNTNGLLKVSYKNFLDYIDIQIIDPRIDLNSKNISVSLSGDCKFEKLNGSLVIKNGDETINEKLEISSVEQYSQNGFILKISAIQKPEACGDSADYTNLKEFGANYEYTSQEGNPHFDINNIQISRVYKVNENKVTKELKNNSDYRVCEETDKYEVKDLYENTICTYTKK